MLERFSLKIAMFHSPWHGRLQVIAP